MSVTLYEEFCKEIEQPTQLMDNVKQFILCTIDHKPKQLSSPEEESDLKYFLDFDIAVLGKPFEEYWKYAQNIRREYIHYSEEDYRKGRIFVLNKLMDSGLFLTEEFRNQFHERAKENMKREIEILLSNQT